MRVTKGQVCLVLKWTDADGGEHTKSTGIRLGDTARQQRANRGQAQRMAAELERELKGSRGSGEGLRGLAESYVADLESRGRTYQHCGETLSRIEAMLEHCKFREPDQLELRAVSQWLVKLRRSRSARTCNAYLAAAKAFCRWLCEQGELAENPLEFARTFEATEKRQRRALSADELGQLINAAAVSGDTVEGLCGPQRALLYVVAAWTGLRRGELGRVVWRDIDLAGGSIALDEGRTKNRKRAVVPLHASVVAAVRTWRADLPTIRLDAPVFVLTTKGGWPRKTSKMVKADLTAAKLAWVNEAPGDKAKRRKSDALEYVDSEGRYADFHGLRKTYVTMLARSGVHPTRAAKLARHRDPKLTLQIYTDLGLDEQSAEVARLPDAPQRKVE